MSGFFIAWRKVKMAQESRLVIVIDSQNAERNVKALAEELSKFTDRGDSASKSSKDMGKELSVTNNIVQNFNTTVNNSNTSVQKSVAVTKQATQQNHKFAQEIKATTNELDKQDKAANSFGTSIKALAGYMAGLATVNAAIGQIDAYTGLQNRLKLVTKDQTELNKATEDTFRIAQNTYSTWDSVLQVYQRFSDNTKTLNLTMDDTARLTKTVSKAAGIVHKGEVVWSKEDIKRWGGVGLVENMRKSSKPEAFINNHAQNNTSAENVFNRSFLSSKAFNDNQNISNIFNQPTRENQIIVNALKPSKDAVSRFGDI